MYLKSISYDSAFWLFHVCSAASYHRVTHIKPRDYTEEPGTRLNTEFPA